MESQSDVGPPRDRVGDTHDALKASTFTVADRSVVTVGEGALAADHREGAPALGAAGPTAEARSSLDVYTRKLRKRLRDGVKERVGGGVKVQRVPGEVAALVTRDAVAAIFPSGKAEGACGVCNEHKEGLSLQLVRYTEATITLAPMCASCVVGLRKPKPPRPERERELAKRYTLWKEMTKMTFEASSAKEGRRKRWDYFKSMEKAVRAFDWKGDAWSSATKEERDLFVTGLNSALIVRNKTKFAEKAKEARGAALLKEMQTLERESDAEHCMTDVLG